MSARGINVGCIAQPELEVHGRGYFNDGRHLVVADEATEVVGHFDIDIYGNLHRLPDGSDLRRGQVG